MLLLIKGNFYRINSGLNQSSMEKLADISEPQVLPNLLISILIRGT